MLVQGRLSQIEAVDRDSVLRVLGTVDHRQTSRRHAPVAAAIFGAVFLLSALRIVSLPIAVLLGVLGAVATRCITPEEAYRQVEWKAIVVIGCMLALGRAMEDTGAAQLLAAQIAGVTGALPARWLLTAFFALTLLLTQPMSNQAAAVVVLPLAVQTARQLGLNPRTFAIMIAVAASCSYLTPLEPACLIVYGPGRYRFTDFLRVGAPLTVLVYLAALVLVPWIWPM
jgi:di/tricarboxylate transporter